MTTFIFLKHKLDCHFLAQKLPGAILLNFESPKLLSSVFIDHPPTHLPLTLFPLPCPFSLVQQCGISHYSSFTVSTWDFPFHMFGHPLPPPSLNFPFLPQYILPEPNPVCSAFFNFFHLEIMYPSSC